MFSLVFVFYCVVGPYNRTTVKMVKMAKIGFEVPASVLERTRCNRVHCARATRDKIEHACA